MFPSVSAGPAGMPRKPHNRRHQLSKRRAAIARFITIVCPHGGLICVQIFAGTWDSSFQAVQRDKITADDACLGLREIVHAKFQ